MSLAGKPAGLVLLHPSAFVWVFPLEISALGGDVLHLSYVLFRWAGCVCFVVTWLLWSVFDGLGGCVASVVSI